VGAPDCWRRSSQQMRCQRKALTSALQPPSSML
jgi:hypothetical protein